MEEIDTFLTDYPTCPHCEYEHEGIDPSEWHSTNHDCDECGKPFKCEADYSVSYVTTKLEGRS